MKNKITFGIVFLFVIILLFGLCVFYYKYRSIYRPYNENVERYKKSLLINIAKVDFVSLDSIIFLQCGEGLWKNNFRGKQMSLQIGEEMFIPDHHGGPIFILKKINIQEKSLEFKYNHNFFLYEKTVHKGDFKIFNSEIKSCQFWEEEKRKRMEERRKRMIKKGRSLEE